MKRALKTTMALAALLCFVLPAAAQRGEGGETHIGGDDASLGKPRNASPGSKIIEKMEFAPIEWKVPRVGEEVKRTEWENGTIVYMMEDHTLPTVSVRAQIRTGSIYEPAELAGIASMTGGLLRDGGTASWSAEEIDKELEFYAARVSSRISTEEGNVTLSCLTKDLDRILPIWAEVLTRPRFAQDKIDLEISQAKEGLRRRFDSPGSTVSYLFDQRMYGDHPLGRTIEWDTLARIDRDAMVSFHKRYFLPNNTMISVVGDVDSDTVQKVKAALADWKPGPVSLPEVPPAPKTVQAGVWYVDQDINQTNIRMGHLGTTWNDPDRYALQLMNFILGGGSFTSRMTERVRSDEGLAYSVGSYYQAGQRVGTFAARTQTRVDATARTIEIMRDTIEGMRAAPPTEEELNLAKDSYINRYVFQFQDPESVVSQLMDLEYYDRPRDQLETYLGRIRAVSSADIHRVAQKHLHPDSMVLVVVGDTESFDRPLAELQWEGQIQLASLPETPATEQQTPRARAAGGRGGSRRGESQ